MPKRFLDILVVLVLALSLWPAAVRADETEDDMGILQMYYDEKDLRVSVTRNDIPLSSVAETVTVVTAQDIAAMNAHTVGDVLYHVPGVQATLRGGPGTATSMTIRGGSFSHVKVVLDGIPLNDTLSVYPDVDAIPSRIVERIEVLRGPASSAWGSALGGVINIITKRPEEGKRFAGNAYSSVGENSFHDVGGDLSGTVGRFGYYLYGGNLSYDGLSADNAVRMNSAHGKFTWSLADKGEITGVFGVSRPDRELFGGGITDNAVSTNVYSGLSGRYRILTDTELEVSLRYTGINNHLQQAAGPATKAMRVHTPSGGGTVILRQKAGVHAFAAGVEFDTGKVKFSSLTKIETEDDTITIPGNIRKHVNQYGVFLTDTITLGRFSLTPSIRYDAATSGANRDNLSMSLGSTFWVTDGTLLRVTTGRGYSLPEFVTTDPIQKIWGVQAGVESTDVPYLWTRATYFYNHMKKTLDFFQNIENQDRQGVELEVKTVPVFNTSLTGGLMLMETMSARTHRTVKYVPTWQWNAGIRYDDGDWKALLQGHQVWWNTDAQYGSEYDDGIWDLHVSKKVDVTEWVTPELFFSVHNIFDGDEYVIQFFKNPGRWVEGGIRFSF